jgi:hypothetical protein
MGGTWGRYDPQGRGADAMWCTGARHDPCSAPCGMAAPAEVILGCCAALSAHLLGTEPKPLGSGSVSPRNTGWVAVNACRLIGYVYARAVCVSRALQRSERPAWCSNTDYMYTHLMSEVPPSNRS